MRISRFITRTGKFDILQQIDALISLLEECHLVAEKNEFPELVDLEHALERAKHLRSLIVKGEYSNWEMILKLLLILSAIAEKIYVMINCIFSQEIRYESWVYNKDSENYRGHFTRYICGDARSKPILSFTNRARTQGPGFTIP